MNFKMDLSPEERLAYEFARRWRDENYRPDLQKTNWLHFANILTHNRMAVLAGHVFARVNPSIPPLARKLICEQAEKHERSASKFGDALTTYLESAESRNIPTIVLKGLWLCEKIYRVPSMRPGGDIDILVHRNDVDASLKLLAEQGIDEFWPNLLKDEYFTRHHLHQQRCSADLNIWFEIHWALDHPYTLLTVDYESIFERAKPDLLLGAPIQEMPVPDLLLSLAIHLVKHGVYLPSLLDQEDLPRIILADGMLMYYLDVTEVLKQHQDDIDWDLTIQLARAWSAVEILGSVLQVCKRYFGAPVPDEALSALRVSRPSAVTRQLMGRVAEQELAAYEGREGSRFWKLALASNGAFILRPIRLLETISYFFPPSDFLNHRYGKANLLTRTVHLSTAFVQTLRFAWDTFYFGMERYFRLKRMGKSTSLFNKLETHL
ncbi:MAG TPA: nucleotidyltransferase family protein [Anaerolineales bacterium]|nr:nucleotidyltransferase family protein [Anaerolineales bacterium]